MNPSQQSFQLKSINKLLEGSATVVDIQLPTGSQKIRGRPKSSQGKKLLLEKRSRLNAGTHWNLKYWPRNNARKKKKQRKSRRRQESNLPEKLPLNLNIRSLKKSLRRFSGQLEQPARRTPSQKPPSLIIFLNCP